MFLRRRCIVPSLALFLTIALPIVVGAQTPDIAAARLAALTAEAIQWRGFRGSPFLDPAPYQLRATPTGSVRTEPPFPARTPTEVEAMATAAGARIAAPEQLIKCVSESATCTLPPTGTLLLEIGDPIIEGTQATVLLRSRVVGSFRDGTAMHRAVRIGEMVRYHLEQQDGRWQVVKRVVLVAG